MKKLIIFFVATLLCCAAAMAQQSTPHFAMAHATGDGTTVYTDDGRTFEVEGEVLDLGMDGNTVWTLTRGERNIDFHDLRVGVFRVYKNDKRKKTYKGNDDERYFSMAMRVKDGHVVVAGSMVAPFNDKGFQSCLFGEVDFERVFETNYERKSLKRSNFRGFYVVKDGRLDVPIYDLDGTAYSVYYGVKDVDYYKGNIYATGWGEREYTQTYGTKYYFVRRCPRVWRNGKEYVQQVENQTGAAYCINVVNADGKRHILTSGHNRGLGCGWDGNKLIYNNPVGNFVVDEEAAIAKGSKIYRCCLVNRDHLCFIVQDGNSGSVEKVLDSVDYDTFFYDVVADPANMDFYLLTRSYRGDDYEVWKLHCSGTTLKAPKKVFTFSTNEAGSSPKLAISL